MTPRFVLSKKTALGKYEELKEVSDILAYSVKTNPVVAPILEKETDALFSIHMVNELKHVKDAGRVVFLCQGWDEELVKELIEKGIKWFVVDNEHDLGVLIEHVKANDDRINLLLRVKLGENTIRTERYFVFGMGKEVVNKQVKKIREELGKKIISLGVHFHRKTQNTSEWELRREIENMLEKDVLGVIDVINIGGGLPCEYANTRENVAGGIIKELKELKLWLNGLKIKLMLEPGRFISAPACKLVTRIVNIYGNTIVVNASVYNTNLDALIVPVKLRVEGELKKGEGRAYAIKGITPCSMDLFRYRVYLKNPKIGDELVFLNAGAYNFRSDFCELDKVGTEVV